MKRTLIVNKTNFDGSWAAEYLSGIFQPGMSVCVLTSEMDEGYTSGVEDWETQYGSGSDFRYDIERPFRNFGIRSFIWCDSHRDDPEQIRTRIRNASVCVLFGTSPSACMNVLEDGDLIEPLMSTEGILVTISEVSEIVCREFENEELYDRGIRRGLGILQAAHLCMHYDESEEQMRRMIRQLETDGGNLLVLSERSGVYLEDGHIELLGDAFIAEENDLDELYGLL